MEAEAGFTAVEEGDLAEAAGSAVAVLMAEGLEAAGPTAAVCTVVEADTRRADMAAECIAADTSRAVTADPDTGARDSEAEQRREDAALAARAGLRVLVRLLPMAGGTRLEAAA